MAILFDTELIYPESGWIRYFHNDSNFDFFGNWGNVNVSQITIGSYKKTSEKNAYFRFNFTGTTFRLISVLGGYKPSSFIEVYIDGLLYEKTTISMGTSNLSYNRLNMEAVSLENKEHSVVIKNVDVDGNSYMLIGVDLEEDGKLLPYNPSVRDNSYNKYILAPVGGGYRYWNNDSWGILYNYPTEADFIKYGVNNLNVIPYNAMKEFMLTYPNFKILTYAPKNNFVEIVQRKRRINKELHLNALPVGQLVTDDSSSSFIGVMRNLQSSESSYVNGKILYLVSFDDEALIWRSYKDNVWIEVTLDNIDEIRARGMTQQEFNTLDYETIKSLYQGNMKIAYYIDEGIGENEEVALNYVHYISTVGVGTSKLKDIAMYVLNTTATIQLTFTGNTLVGAISDLDSGKVQYRVILNGTQYYPVEDGEFTNYQTTPLDISFGISDKYIKMGEANRIKVEFRDAWGQTDYWEAEFVGKQQALMFMDEKGNYYSTQIGQVLKTLDFGQVTAGTNTMSYNIRVKNYYDYPIENVRISTNFLVQSDGASLLLSKKNTPFEGMSELVYTELLEPDGEIDFWIMLTSTLDAQTVANGQFDIRVSADKA